MSSSMRIYGFKTVDDKYRRMKAVWDACKVAGLSIPEEVDLYFDHQEPDPAGVRMDLQNVFGVQRHEADMERGFEVDLRNIPPDIQIIRFVNRY